LEESQGDEKGRGGSEEGEEVAAAMEREKQVRAVKVVPASMYVGWPPKSNPC
jgi:hypothetical protein